MHELIYTVGFHHGVQPIISHTKLFKDLTVFKLSGAASAIAYYLGWDTATSLVDEMSDASKIDSLVGDGSAFNFALPETQPATIKLEATTHKYFFIRKDWMKSN